MSIFNNNSDISKVSIRVDDLETRVGMISSGSKPLYGASITGELPTHLDSKSVDIATIAGAGKHINIVFKYSGEGILELLLDGLIVGYDYLGMGTIMASFDALANVDYKLSVRGLGKFKAFCAMVLGEGIKVDSVTSFAFTEGDRGVVALCNGINAYVCDLTQGVDLTQLELAVGCDIASTSDGYILALVDTDKRIKLVYLDYKLQKIKVEYLSIFADSVAIVNLNDELYMALIESGKLSVGRLRAGTLLGKKAVNNSQIRFVKWGKLGDKLLLLYTTAQRNSYAIVASIPIGGNIGIKVSKGINYSTV